jgi:hypothetical protein
MYSAHLAYPVGFLKRKQNDTTAPYEWGPWWDFTSANATQSCSHYPNEIWYQASFSQLVLELQVHGIPLGAGANVTLQVRPARGRSSRRRRSSRRSPDPYAVYQITSRAANLKIYGRWAAKTWPAPPKPSQVTLTYILNSNWSQSGSSGTAASMLLLKPERIANRKYWNMMAMATASPLQRPKLLQIVQGYHGQDDIDGWAEASTAIKALGANGLRTYPSRGLHELLQVQGDWPFISTVSGLLKDGSYGPGLSGNVDVDGDGATWWGGTEEQLLANITQFAQRKLGPYRRAGFTSGLAQVAIHDEPRWYLPAERNLSEAHAAALNSGAGPFGFRFDLPDSVPHYQLKRYEEFLTANNVTLEMLGAERWEQALPVSRFNLSSVVGDVSAAATALKLRFYWGVRFYSWSATTFYSKVTAALIKEADQGPLTVYTNYNNFHGRFFTPMVPTATRHGKADPHTSGASGLGNYDWFEAGR